MNDMNEQQDVICSLLEDVNITTRRLKGVVLDEGSRRIGYAGLLTTTYPFKCVCIDG